MKKKELNIVIAGVGGQGVLTIEKILVELALRKGFDVKASEQHGLAQRGGAIECHVRIGMGKKINSSLVAEGDADLIIGFEQLEGLRACSKYGSEKTVVLLDEYVLKPLSVYVSSREYPDCINEIRKITNNLEIVKATEEVEKAIGEIFPANIFLLGYAVSKKLLPFSKEEAMTAIKEKLRQRYFEANKKAFDLASEY